MNDEVAEVADINGSPQGNRGTWERRTLCRELATGDVKRSDLARKYGITPGAITRFAQRHALEIDSLKRALSDEFAGLWVASKEERIAAYQADYELAASGKLAGHHEWIKARTAILRAVAEELGRLPPRATINVLPVLHVIEGVDLNRLS